VFLTEGFFQNRIRTDPPLPIQTSKAVTYIHFIINLRENKGNSQLFADPSIGLAVRIRFFFNHLHQMSLNSTIFSALYERSGDPNARRLLSILEAAKEAIAVQAAANASSNSKTSKAAAAAAAVDSPLALFGALMSALERTGAEHSREIFYLLSILLPHVPVIAFRSKIDPVFAMIDAALASPVISKDQPTIRCVVTTLAHTLRVIEPEMEVWSRPSIAREFNILLSFCVDTRPKVRRAAHAGALAISAAHHSAKSNASGALFGAFFDSVLRGGASKDQAAIMHVAPLVKQILPLLPLPSIETVVDRVLKVTSIGQPLMTVFAYSSLAMLLESPRAKLSSRFVQTTLEALRGLAPSPDDTHTAPEYSYLIAAGLTRLASMERIRMGFPPDVPLVFPREGVRSVALSSSSSSSSSSDPSAATVLTLLAGVSEQLPFAVNSLISNFETDQTSVHHATANALAISLVTCVDGAMVNEACQWRASHPVTPSDSPSAPALIRVAYALDSILQYRFQASWSISLPIVAVLFRLLGPDSHYLLKDLVKTLVVVRSAVSDAAEAAAELREQAQDEEGREFKKRRGVNRRNDEEEEEHEEGGKGEDGRSRSDSRKIPHAVVVFRTVQRVLGAALQAMGAKHFIDVVGFTIGDVLGGGGGGGVNGKKPYDDFSGPRCVLDSRSWVLALLRENAQHSAVPISFFLGSIAPSIVAEEEAWKKAENAHQIKNARAHKARVMQLWGTLPSLLIAPPDFATPLGFGANLGNMLTRALTDSVRLPELPTIIGRALETVIVRNRAAAGLPVASIKVQDDYDEDHDGGEDEGDADVNNNNKREGDEGLTVFQQGKGKSKTKATSRRRQAEELDDENDDNNDGNRNEDDYEGRTEPGYDANDDGATTVFGAGGVSVYAGGSSSDPRHPLIVQAMGGSSASSAAATAYNAKDRFPPISKDDAHKNLAVIALVAKNYLPVLFNAFEKCALGVGAITQAAPSTALASQLQIQQLPASVSNERSRKVLDAIVAYVSVSPKPLVTAMCDRLHKLLVAALSALSAQQDMVKAAIANLRAATAEDTRVRSKNEAARAKAAAAAGAAPVNPLHAAAKVPPSAATQAAGAEVSNAKKSVFSSAARASALLSLTLAVVPGLEKVTTEKASSDDGSMISKLYVAIRPAIIGEFDNSTVQKRAYAVLACILKLHPFFAVSSTRRQDVLDALTGGITVISTSARRGRLACLRHIIKALELGEESNEGNQSAVVIPTVLGEVLLCCKDSNSSVRESAFSLVVAMARKMFNAGGEGDGSLHDLADVVKKKKSKSQQDEEEEEEEVEEEDGDDAGDMEDDDDEDEDDDDKGNTGMSTEESAELPPPSLTEFFKMIYGALQASTPHMRSAALLALSRLIYEFIGEAEVIRVMVLPLLSHALKMLKEQAREVVTSAVSFVRIAVACTPPTELRPQLQRIVNALLVWSGERKERIKKKVRLVLERLVRKFGFEEVAKFVPQSDEALIRYMRKMAARRERKRGLGVGGEGAEGASRASGAARTAFEKMAGLVDGDNDDEDEDDDDDDFFGDQGQGGKEGASVISGASSRWPGTTMRSSAAMTRIGGPGSRMSGVTSDMRSNSRILMAAAASLPPVGVLIDPTGTGGKKTQKERTVVFTKLVGGGTNASRITKKSGASASNLERNSRGKSGASGAMLRADDESPLDFLDPKSMRSAGVGQDAIALAAAEKQRRSTLAFSSGSGPGAASGFSLASDGRLIIREEAEAISGKAGHRQASGDDDNLDNDEDIDDLRDGTAKIRRAKARKVTSVLQGEDDNNNVERDEEDEGGRDRNARDRSVFSAGGGKRHFRKSEDEGGAVNKQGWGMAKGKNSSKFGERKSSSSERFSGSQFKGGKGAKGDVKTSGSKFEPFAYVELGAVASGQGGFSSVMASTSKSVRKNFKRGIVAEAEASRDSTSLSGTKRGRS
jgi:hypothetical protein